MNWFMDILLSTSTYIHAGYIGLIFVLFIENRQTTLMLYKSIDRNIETGEGLIKLKNNMIAVQGEQLKLIKESHSHSYEIQMLNQQLARLRDELKLLNTQQKDVNK